MKNILPIGIGLMLVIASHAWAANGLITLKSPHSPKATMDRLENLLKQKNMTIFARIDHAAGAAKIGQSLRPTELLIFGNPQGGTAFMLCEQTVGIDLPLKALVWQDAQGQVWLGYNDPEFLAKRHGTAQCPVVEKLKKALVRFAREAVAK
jgi:uncharacterized protein (DUF302 family)